MAASSPGGRADSIRSGWVREAGDATGSGWRETEQLVIRMVSFDGDDTLWDFERAMLHGLRMTLEELWVVKPQPDVLGLTVQRLVEVRRQVGRELRGRVASLEAIRLAAFERILEEVGIADPELAVQLTGSYLHHRLAATELFADVLPALDQLGGRYRLALITDGNTPPERCGLEGRFEAVVTAAQCGVGKPDQRIFLTALDAIRIAAAEAVHVGDSLGDDVAGAQATGMGAVWLNRAGRANDTEVEPDGEIRSLEELPELMAAW